MTAVGPIEKVYEPSHIRRGRLSTTPTWYVNTLSGERWRFQRKKDATAFIERHCARCPDCGDDGWQCRTCGAQLASRTREPYVFV
jgi:hypothetical protein